jgi:hypothetical protein
VPRVATTANITNPQRYGYDVRIDELLLRSAAGPDRTITIQSSDVQDNKINVSRNPEDFTSNIGRIYSRNNFNAGQGLDTAHRADPKSNDGNRFWDSKGIDVFHGDDETSYNIHLLHTTAPEGLSFSDTNNYLVQTTNGNLYVTDGTEINQSTDDGVTWSAIAAGTTGATHNYTGLAAVGNTLYATTADGTSGSQLIYYDGSSWSILSNAQASTAGLTGIWFTKGQLFISGDDGTVERLWAVSPFEKTWSSSDLVDGDRIVTFEDTHHISQIADAGAVVLVAATDGNIYSIKEVEGTMTLKGQTTIPFEEVHSIAAAEGQVFFGTKEYTRDVGRFYRAQLSVADDLYVLAGRQLIKEWVIDGIDTTPKHMFVSRDSVYCGIQEDTNESYLWRYYLPTAGMARDLEAGAGGHITGITIAGDKFCIVVAGGDLYRETSLFKQEGYLITSAADFFTAEHKQFVGAEVSTHELADNTSVELEYSTVFEALNDANHSSYKNALTQIIGVGDLEKQIAEVSRYIIGKVILKSSDQVSTPYVKSLQFRALARPELVVVQIPINISDRVERPNRKPLRVKGLGDALYSAIKQKEGDAVTLQLYNPKETIRGVVEQISYPIVDNENIGSDTMFAVVTIRGTRVPLSQDPTSEEVFGLQILGKAIFGG